MGQTETNIGKCRVDAQFGGPTPDTWSGNSKHISVAPKLGRMIGPIIGG